MKRIFCAPSVGGGGGGGGDSKLSCGTIRRGKTSNRNNSDDDDDDDDETKMNSTTRSKEKWSNAYEKFRKEASDLTEEEAKELWRKTKECMQQEDEVQLRLYAELDLIYGSDDEDEDAGEEIGDDDEKKKNKKAADEKNTKLKRNSQKHKDLVHERVRIALANEIRQKAIEADSVDPFDMIMSSSDQSLEKVGLSRIRIAR